MKEAAIIIGIIVVIVVIKLVFKSSTNDMTASASAPANISEDDIKNLIRKGRKIEAIKQYRSMTGVGLKEAKDAVDNMEV